MKYTINVTADHIIRGSRSNTCLCPIALAANEDPEIRKAGEAFVGSCYINIVGNKADSSRKIRLPSNAVAFIRLFDRGEAVGPFSFDIEL